MVELVLVVYGKHLRAVSIISQARRVVNHLALRVVFLDPLVINIVIVAGDRQRCFGQDLRGHVSCEA